MENDFLNGVYVEEWEHSGKSDRFLCPDFKKPNGKLFESKPTQL